MNNRPEQPLYSEVKRHIDKPWYSLKPYDIDILRTAVKPLSENLIDELINTLVSNDPQRRHLAKRLHDSNADLLDGSDRVALILDGRSNGHTEGFLGDMIEASRLVKTIRTCGKNVTILTPHNDLFQGTTDPGVNLVPIPSSMWAEHTLPWSREFLSYIHNSVGEVPCIFPMNANMPAFIQVDKEGLITNNETLDLAKAAFRPLAQKMRMTPVIWGRKGIHQLQALQIVACLLGIDEANKWREFPPAFLHPTERAQGIAQEVIKMYGCFDNGATDKECPPLYLHPGIAVNDFDKLARKFYPEARWMEVIQGLTASRNIANSLTFLEPTDPKQGAMTLRLATEAVEAGMRVAKVPMASVKKEYDWSLGAFIAFLQELSKHKGIIVGCDSMPAGHAGPATGNPAVVLGSHWFNPGFFCPPEKALVVIPSKSPETSSIEANRVVSAIRQVCLNQDL